MGLDYVYYAERNKWQVATEYRKLNIQVFRRYLAVLEA